jgi:hypothetical protein
MTKAYHVAMEVDLAIKKMLKNCCKMRCEFLLQLHFLLVLDGGRTLGSGAL